VTERALDANGLKPAITTACGRHADDRVRREQPERDGRIAEIDSLQPDRVQRRRRQRFRIDLQPDGQRRARTETSPDTTEARPLYGLVKPQRRAPELFVAERVEAENLPATLEEIHRVIGDLSIEGRRPAV
jgi:hypothetical protein